MRSYLPRAMEKTVAAAARRFPAVLLTGVRQCGKTTLLRHAFGNTHGFVSLDLPEVEDLATRDPQLFLVRHPAPVVVDEVQRAPALLRYLKDHIETTGRRPGRYILTGSQAFPLMQGVTESLAGRVAVLELATMSSGEQDGRGATWKVPPVAARSGGSRGSAITVARRMLRGGFPELVVRRNTDVRLWFESFVQTYLERDVRQLRQVGDLRDFRRFMVALAARAGQLLSLSEVSRDLGVAVNTVKAWVSVLEASHVVLLLPPFARNLTKRLVKTPKVYFHDTGLLCHLLGLSDETAVLSGAIGGAVFENLVLGELVRAFLVRGLRPDITFFRSSDGLEVDFLVNAGGRLHPVEVKRSATPRPEMADCIEPLHRILPGDLAPGLVVMLSGARMPLTRRVDAVGFDGIS
jgi:predicted AAA+ superfamily ATPase